MLQDKIAKDIQDAVDHHFDDQVDVTAALVGFPSKCGNEATAQDFMAGAFAARGLTVDRWKLDVDDFKHLPGFSPVPIPQMFMVSTNGSTWRACASRPRPSPVHGKLVRDRENLSSE